MQQTDVNPPAAAARDPLSIVSACSNPGSRRCTCMSMKPGATIRPPASKTCALGDERSGATAATRPSTIRTSAMWSVCVAGSITRPFLMTIDMRLSNHLFQHRHPDRDAVLDLIQNDRTLEVGDLARKLPPAIDGAGVHHDGVRPG